MIYEKSQICLFLYCMYIISYLEMPQVVPSANSYRQETFKKRLPTNISLFNVKKRNTIKSYDICSKITIKTSD